MQPLYRYAFHLTRDPSTAEDLTQETWLKVWQKASAYRQEKARVSTWLHRILHNHYVDQNRKTWRERFFGLPNDKQSATVGSDEDIDWSASLSADTTDQEAPIQTQQLDQALRDLPINQRSALVLQLNSGLSNSEVAHILGIGVRAVESLQSLARRNLREALENIHDQN